MNSSLHHLTVLYNIHTASHVTHCYLVNLSYPLPVTGVIVGIVGVRVAFTGTVASIVRLIAEHSASSTSTVVRQPIIRLLLLVPVMSASIAIGMLLLSRCDMHCAPASATALVTRRWVAIPHVRRRMESSEWHRGAMPRLARSSAIAVRVIMLVVLLLFQVGLLATVLLLLILFGGLFATSTLQGPCSQLTICGRAAGGSG